MSTVIYRLVYYSRNHIPDQNGELDAEIKQILERSRVNNDKDGITGALLFNAGCFAQVLEGPLDAVERTFERIQQDERHGDVSLLALEPIAERAFGSWAMGFLGRSETNAHRFAEVGTKSGFDVARLSGDEIHSVLKRLAIEEEAAAA
ncbi:BLUF domain-containing protein [Pararhizobium mangrovi]|uniref:BLUF domain-containing protein n=1 Tax=Pararhizobium mangrovi TaxID=2590452 RepID=A0A506TYT1_9HYPH|nr:BLUF domain-containing protein [Pararhizobium mangrovi]TPW26141.1 BLUF domain-containing protein [Pararhizobium mangrovi]